MKKTLAVFVAAVLGVCAASYGQGVQTGTLTGTATDQTGLVLPGVSVTATSPAMQGVRETVTDANGMYTMPALPPGTYAVRFELPGMSPVTRENATVPLGGMTTIDATLSLGGVVEQVTVTAPAPGAVSTPTADTHMRSREINALPMGRTPVRIAELQPGLTDNAPQTGQVTISGGFGYDNVFMVNGVDVNDNIFGTANDLFIEDAVEEVQVLTSGISAEYGRFSGGVVNLITRSGSNTFAGSARMNLTNPSWTKETPFEQARNIERVDKLSTYFEGTLGGPLVRDRVWFFGANRRERSENQRTLALVGTPVVQGVNNDRYELKLTGTPLAGHTVQGSYIDGRTTDLNRASLALASSVDPRVFIDRKTPNTLFVSNYNGMVGQRTLVTAQYSQRQYGFRNNGGTSTAVADSPFRSRGLNGVASGLHYNAPFLSAHDPQDRNNRQFAGSATYFLTTRGLGSHTVKAGGEHFTSTLIGGNSQTATGYVFQSDFEVAGGVPVLDEQGRLIPQFQPGVSRVQSWRATPGARIDIETISFYLQDHWAASRHFSFELGLRGETVNSRATGDVRGADSSRIVPRLGMTYDIAADGKNLLQATYAHYAGKTGESQFVRNTVVGNPGLVTYQYTGPAGAGFDFAPGLNPANYTQTVSGTFPTANVSFADGLRSPLTREFTVGGAREFRRGYARATYTWRNASDFIDDFIDDPTDQGRVTVTEGGFNFGTFDRVEYRNTSVPRREYQGVQMLGRYNLFDNLYVNGHYTVQIKNDGNFEGEAANSPGASSSFGDYPEILVANRNFPEGRLNDFQRHKVRVWAVSSHDLGRAGSLDVAPLWRYNSALTYSLQASTALSAVQLARNPGYARLPGGGTQTIYFGELGSQEFAGYGLVDVAATYTLPIWRSLRPWLKAEVFNVLNNDKLIAWNTTVTPDRDSALDADGLPTGYVPAANFGQPRSSADYARPLPGVDGGRTFQMAFGVRF